MKSFFDRKLDMKTVSQKLTRSTPAAVQINLIKRALINEDWRILQPWPWVNVWLRANRNGVDFNLVVHEPEFCRLATVIRDTYEAAHEMNVVIGILSRQAVSSETQIAAMSQGIYVLTPDMMWDVEKIIQRVRNHCLLDKNEERAPEAGTSNIEVKHSNAGLNRNGTDFLQSRPSLVRGFVEAIVDGHIWGWAYAPDQSIRPLQVGVNKRDVILATTIADRFRADLRDAGMDDGCHGFEITSRSIRAQDLLSLKVYTTTLDGSVVVLNPTEHVLKMQIKPLQD